MNLEPMTPEDWPSVQRIYREGIATGEATFETEVPEWEAFDQGHLTAGRLVARAEGEVTGWAALSPVSSRCVYGGVAEVSVYVGEGRRGRGVGSVLLQALVDAAEAAGIWTLQAGIFPENAGSIGIHLRLGFREVGRRERLGRLAGRWRDVILLERRSRVVGTERELPRALLHFVELFNREAFWESHEVLEGPWRELGSDFYQGLILYASAFVHLQRANPHGIQAQLAKAELALESYRPSYLGVDVEEILDWSRKVSSQVEGGTLPGEIPPPRIALSPDHLRGNELELLG